MGSGIGVAGHTGWGRGPGKASKNNTSEVFEPFQGVLEALGLSWVPSKHYFLRSKTPAALWDTVLVDPTPSGALQDDFLTIQRLLEPSRTLFLSTQRLLELSRALLLSVRGLLNLSRTIL